MIINEASRGVRFSMLAFAVTMCSAGAFAASVPASTAIPVTFTMALDSGKVKVNDPVRAQTMQVVLLPDGEQIPRGSVVVGHIVDSRPFHLDETPYARQQSSVLSIQFDQIDVGGRSIPVRLKVRAMANVMEVDKAMSPTRLDETDAFGTMILIGGDHYQPMDHKVRSTKGDVVAYKRNQGVFAHLVANESAQNQKCDATQSEQSIAVFSANACGLYGFSDYALSGDGSDASGAIMLESGHSTVKLYAHSAALLETL